MDGPSSSSAARKRFCPDGGGDVVSVPKNSLVEIFTSGTRLSQVTVYLRADLEEDTSATDPEPPSALSRRTSVVFWRTVTM